MKLWHNIKDDTPDNGDLVQTIYTKNSTDPEEWITDYSYYCENGFYKLTYDPHLGVLRKTYVTDPIEYWTVPVQISPTTILNKENI